MSCARPRCPQPLPHRSSSFHHLPRCHPPVSRDNTVSRETAGSSRRRALTEAQLENLLALPIAEPDLVQHWTLSDTDFAAIDQRRRDRNRIGFALQLCALRYPGRLLRPGELIPAEALRFIAEQLGADPDALTSYATRSDTLTGVNATTLPSTFSVPVPPRPTTGSLAAGSGHESSSGCATARDRDRLAGSE